MSKKITIAIDGYSSCGKSTIAKALAAELGYNYVDSGAMYRAVTLYCVQNDFYQNGSLIKSKLLEDLDKINVGFVYNDKLKRSDVSLNDEVVEDKIRNMDISSKVSEVSAIVEVRKKMVSLQQEMGKDKGVVMDGRDIGTVVFPDAELKLFMTADVDIRTFRRLDELKAKGENTDFNDVKKSLIARDHADTTRKDDPLTQADDAIVLDNSELNKKQQLDFVLKLVNDLIED
jgi:CMP/dCMP kinase